MPGLFLPTSTRWRASWKRSLAPTSCAGLFGPAPSGTADTSALDQILDRASPLTIAILNLVASAAADLGPRQEGYIMGLVSEQVVEWAIVTAATDGAATAIESGALASRIAKVLEGAEAIKNSPKLQAIVSALRELKVAGRTAGEIAGDLKDLVQGGRVQRFLQNIQDYWEIAGGISKERAAELAKAEGFGFDIGRESLFNNDRTAVIIGRGALKDGLVNRIELAEEIQHGVDRATHEASRAIRRGLSRREFHSEVFQRIIDRYNAGGYKFLTPEDIEMLKLLVKEMKKQK